jgi:tRNA(Ser,Leu) C12 N-acetylase TAN1
MARAAFDSLPFNVVAIAEPRASARAIASLRPVGAFRATPYRRVLVGSVEDASESIVRAWHSAPEPFHLVVRMIPLERVVGFTGNDVTEALCCALEDIGARVAGKTFHVRARLRGLAGRLHKTAVERALGGFLLDLAERAGAPARVRFSDPDAVLAVEVIGHRVGYGLLGREARSIPLVRPR